MCDRSGLLTAAGTAALALLVVLCVGPLGAQTIMQGDVFASVNSGMVSWYQPNGTFVKTINTGQGGFTTGGAFNAAGHLFITNFSAASVTEFDTAGNVVATYPTGGSSPESILFMPSGDILVGHAFSNTRRYNPSFNQIANYPVQGGSDWIDLQPDQCTLLHTFEGSAINRYNICTQTQLTPFATGLGGQAFALRIRPNGEVMLANGSNVLRLNSSGGTIQTYQPGAEASGWFALNLDPDGTSFWTGTFSSGNFYKVDIASGNVLLGPVATCGSGCLFGLTVAGELIVSQPTPTPGTAPTATPTATPIPPTPTPPTAVPMTSGTGVIFFIGLLGLTGAILIWRWSLRG